MWDTLHGQSPQLPQPIPGVEAVVAVSSGKGGVEMTTLSVNLALSLTKVGYKVGLLETAARLDYLFATPG